MTSALDSRAFRDSLGQFATGVCVVSIEDGEGRPKGLTVNSFASVSLEPPLVLWSLQNHSDVYESYSAAAHWSVSVLSSQQQDLSDFYARRGEHLIESAHLEAGASPSPLIRDALAQFQCKTHATYPGGDHLIMVGEVLSFRGPSEPDAPLVFFGGQYGQLSS